MTTYRLRPGLTIRELPDGDAVVAVGEGMDAVIVNATAYAILDLLSDEHSEQEIVGLFRSAFPDQDPAAIARDIGQLLQQLLSVGFVEPCGGASPTA